MTSRPVERALAGLMAEQTRPRLAVRLEAGGDLGGELWSTATLGAIRNSQWMPGPPEFLAQARVVS